MGLLRLQASEVDKTIPRQKEFMKETESSKHLLEIPFVLHLAKSLVTRNILCNEELLSLLESNSTLTVAEAH